MSPLLCLPSFDPDGLQNEARVVRCHAPRHDGLHRVPDIGPYCTVLPLELDDDQLANVFVQGDEEGVGFITGNSFAP